MSAKKPYNHVLPSRAEDLCKTLNRPLNKLKTGTLFRNFKLSAEGDAQHVTPAKYNKAIEKIMVAEFGTAFKGLAPNQLVFDDDTKPLIEGQAERLVESLNAQKSRTGIKKDFAIVAKGETLFITPAANNKAIQEITSETLGSAYKGRAPSQHYIVKNADIRPVYGDIYGKMELAG